MSTEVHRNSDADNYRTKKRTAIKSSVCELKLLKQKIEGRKCSKNVVCITWISQYCRISFLFENIWVVRRTFNQSLYSAVVKIAKLCGHWLKCLQKDEIFVARPGKQERNQYILPFSDHCRPTIWFLCNAEYDEYGNTGCGVFKRGVQN